MWRCASASRRERATVYELRIHHAALVIGRSIEPRARRAPGAVPGPFRPAAPRISAIAVINTIAVRIMRVRSGYPGRAPAPIGELGRTVLIHAAPPHPDPSGSRPPRAPWSHPTGDRPTPPLYDFSLLGDGVRRRPTLPVPRCDTGHPAQRAQGARTRLQLGGHTRGHSYFRRPRPTLATRERQSPTQVTLSLSTPLCPLKPLSHPPETLSLALNSSPTTQPLILTHNASTHSHSLTQTHPLTHSHASTHLPLTLTHWRCVSMRTSLGVVERVA